MKWRTEVMVPEGSPRIGYPDKVLLLGSCFADHLGEKMSHYQFPHLSNPFGVLFHPAPLIALLRRAAEGTHFTQEDLFNQQGRWGTLQAHSSLSGNTSNEALHLLNQQLQALRTALEQSSHILITLGTAYGYRYLDDGSIAANCHKLPANAFERELTPISSLEESLSELCTLVHGLNRNSTCLFTVSPVRHIRDGLVENQRSKAHLIAAVHSVVDSGLARYFPSYELLIDELRDYRFYDRDLVHPSPAAVDYVWECFEKAWIDPDARSVMDEVAAIQKGLAHRPLHGDSEEYVRFRKTLEERIRGMQGRFPHMDFGAGGQSSRKFE